MKSFFTSTDKENGQQAAYLFIIANIIGFVTTGILGQEQPHPLVQFFMGFRFCWNSSITQVSFR